MCADTSDSEIKDYYLHLSARTCVLIKKMLKKLFILLAVLCIPIGFFIKHEHAVFFWHRIPSIEAIFGVIGALLLIAAAAILASFAQKKEDFYD